MIIDTFTYDKHGIIPSSMIQVPSSRMIIISVAISVALSGEGTRRPSVADTWSGTGPITAVRGSGCDAARTGLTLENKGISVLRPSRDGVTLVVALSLSF
jgi:hypothetical protein